MMAYVFIEPAALAEGDGWLTLLIAWSAKSVLILGLAGMIAFALRRSAAASRHLVWSLALAGLLALPLLSFALPAWQWSILPEDLRSQAAVPANLVVSLTDQRAAVASAELLSSDTDIGTNHPKAAAIVRRGSPAAAAAGSGTAAQAPDSPAESPAVTASIEGNVIYNASAKGRSVWRWAEWAVTAWFIGAALILAHLLVGTARVWQLARRAEEVRDAEWLSLVGRLSRRLGLTQAITLRRSVRVTMPMACGLVRASVLLPADADDWTRERREVVLLHELAHVKRRDCLTQLMAQAACALYWFNPLAWVATRRLRVERERACDDQVLDAGAKASDYADHLLDIARTMGAAPSALMAAVAIARRSQLEGRLLAILDPRLSRRTLNRATVMLIAVIMLALVSPLAMLRPAISAQTKPPRPVTATPPAAPQAPSAPTVALPTMPATPSVAALAPTPPSPPAPGAPPEAVIAAPAESSAPPAMPAPAVAPAGAAPPAIAPPAAAPATPPQAPQAPRSSLSQQDRDALVESFREALKDSDPEMRDQALFSLSQIGGARATEAIIGALKDQNPNMREKAAWALGMRRGAGQVEALVNALHDENAGVREKAAWALGMRGDRNAVEPLIEALKDKSAEVRASAAWSLGMRGDARAIKPLNAATKDENRDVRSKAIWALGMLLMRSGEGDTQSLVERDKDGQVGEAISGGIASGIAGGVVGGIVGGVSGGIAGGAAGGIASGVRGGVAAGVTGGVGVGFARARGRIDRKLKDRGARLPKAATKQP
jgi:beta-lactamase regulating signal transducer with metallopeptidase domain